LVHGVPVNRVNVNNQAQVIEQIMMENNCIIKGMEIKFVGWLSPKTVQNKKASSLIVEFTKPEDANMAIDEGLIIEAAMQQGEYYEANTTRRILRSGLQAQTMLQLPTIWTHRFSVHGCSGMQLLRRGAQRKGGAGLQVDRTQSGLGEHQGDSGGRRFGCLLCQDRISQQEIDDITQSTSMESALHSLLKPSDDGWTDDSMAELKKELGLALEEEQVKSSSPSAPTSPSPRSVEEVPRDPESRAQRKPPVADQKNCDASRRSNPAQDLEWLEQQETEVVVVEGGTVATQQCQGIDRCRLN
jgi:hypothetical protein